ncbi:pyrroline-5-carboxylate reductase [Formosa sp. L2A11]|uniref:pyrroline-5-carboxylate reductase n=1 Tax=Formosa sp. L2A11 TaxID=2686363 RepID=UPI00131B6654|nr:pyrroline-5-carboxylate reductase [Formosa sp. L2A11]
MKLLVIGAGNMGLTYAEAMSKSKLLKDKKIMILENTDEKIESLNKIPHFEAFKDPKDCIPQADLIFLAVKPYHADDLFSKILPLVTKEQIVVSLMAGVTINHIKTALKLDKVVRTMPNLPAKVGKGLTSYTASEGVSKEELLTIENLLNTTGKSIQVSNENFIDASTGISGSGPAYVFYFMQSMMEAALQMGFSEENSKTLVTQTFTGAIDLFNQDNISPNDWIERVASKGGTTRAAIDSMDNNNVNELIKEAAFAAFNRAIELGKDK